MRLSYLLLVTVLICGSGVATEMEAQMAQDEEPTSTVFDFESGTEPWPNIDDVVMGGVSRSAMRIEAGVARFEGVLSLENNGGFASLRSRPAEHDLSGFDGLALRIRGDGKLYGVRLRTDRQFDGVSYQAKLPSEAGRWVEVRIPFEEFQPGFRGRTLRDYPPLDPAAIQTFGLILSDQQEGPFRLEIDWIRAYRGASTGP